MGRVSYDTPTVRGINGFVSYGKRKDVTPIPPVSKPPAFTILKQRIQSDRGLLGDIRRVHMAEARDPGIPDPKR